jgi:hypothetical protein
MSTFNAFYVRKKATDKDTRAAVKSLFPKASVEDFDEFVGVVLTPDEFEPPEKKLSALSAKLATDVIWVGYQTTAGSFVYHHWLAGTHLRALVYGCAKEGVWERVEGQAEEWEAEQFWGKEELKMCLANFAKSDAERKKLKQMWADGVLVEGSPLPVAGDDTAVEAIMAHYGLEYERRPMNPSLQRTGRASRSS